MGMALVQILAQFLSLGGGAAVAREGAADPALARTLALQFSLAALLLGIVLAATAAVLPIGRYWMFFIFLSAHEAMQQLMQLTLRAENRPRIFLGFALLKTFAWVAIAAAMLGLAPHGIWTLELWLAMQLGAYALVSLAFLAWRGPPVRKMTSPAAGSAWIWQHLPYCLPLIVHGLAQWALNSSDRFVIGWMIGNEKLAIYSLAYTVASVMSVLLSGLGLYLPHEIMKHMDKWASPTMRHDFIKKCVVAYVLILAGVFAAFMVDYSFIGALKYYHYSMPLIIGIVAAALLFLGIYQVYVCYLFAMKATMKLSKITVLVSLLYFVVLVPLVYALGTIGAALATLAAYVYYMAAVRDAAVHAASLDTSLLKKETRAVMAGAACCMLTGLALSGLMMLQT